MASTPEERSLQASSAAHASWAKTPDRSQRTERAREAATKRFENQVDPDGVLDPMERAKRAASAQMAHMKSMQLKSAQARRAKREAQ
jgi:hypothetical protein